MEAAMRLSVGRKPVGQRTIYDWDDLDTLAQLEGLRAVNKKRRAGREKIVRLIHARSRQLAERNRRRPRLVVDNTE
jgi:hypothetical protein